MTTAQIRVLSTATVAALTTDQVAAIETRDLAALTTLQTRALSSDQIVSLGTEQVAAFTTLQLNALLSHQLVALRTDQVSALTTGQVRALSTLAISALSTEQIASIEPLDVAVLTTAQVRTLSITNVQALTSGQIEALTTGLVRVLTTDQLVALSSDQTMALNTAAVAALTTTQVVVLETTDLAAMTTQQVRALTTASIAALRTEQITAMTTAQLCSLTNAQVTNLTPEQKGAFSTDQFVLLNSGTPLILDLNGDGVRTVDLAAGIQFDLFATGSRVHTGWVSPQDAFLVLDRNLDGQINDGSELFGSSTVLASGETAANGYLALRELDEDGDGIISRSDAQWGQLKLWVDANSDGTTQIDEWFGLEQAGIEHLNLEAVVTSVIDNGNRIGLVSDYQTLDGKTHAMADVWFQTDRLSLDGDFQNKVNGLVSALSQFVASPPPVTSVHGGGVGGPLPSQAPAGEIGTPVKMALAVETLRQFQVSQQHAALQVLASSPQVASASGGGLMPSGTDMTPFANPLVPDGR